MVELLFKAVHGLAIEETEFDGATWLGNIGGPPFRQAAWSRR